jgi:acetyl-CoA carboxylase carboxyltransferase component
MSPPPEDRGNRQEWQEALEDLERSRQASRAMGGEERLRKHRDAGKLDVRARIDTLLDPGSFQELGTLVGGEDAPADAVVIGSGRIDSRPVLVAAEDFTVMAGTISAAANTKRYRVAELAATDRVPLVMMLEGAGYRAEKRGHGARTPIDLLAQASCSGRVPLVTAVLGASAGHGALVAPISDFSVMSRHAAIFTAGPPVVAESMGEQVTKEELGGPDVALASGLIHNVADNDEAALAMVRAYLSYFPSSAWSYPPSLPASDGPRLLPELLDVVPRNGRRVYDMRTVVDLVFDGGSILEVQPAYGRPIICSLARLGGHPVAVIANQPLVGAGAINAEAAEKAAHFITVADSFHLPLVFLADNPGVLAGSVSERAAILRKGARMYYAQTQTSSPKLQVTMRKAYGFGSMVMSMVAFEGQSAVFGYPGATMGAMGAAAMSRARGSDEEEAEMLRRQEVEASFRSARGFGFDELIDPRETRNVLLHSLERALSRRQSPAEPVARIGIVP